MELNRDNSTWNPREHGISVSIIRDWLACRELARFRITGVRPLAPSFALTYGIVTHEVMQSCHSAIIAGSLKHGPTRQQVKLWVRDAETKWRKQNPQASTKALEHLELSLIFVDAVLPIYYDYWHEDFDKCEWVACEEFFKTPMTTSDGRQIPFIGKYDAVIGRSERYWLLETKTKSKVDEEDISDLLPMNFQTNSYLVTLRRRYGKKLAGGILNIVRRPGLRQGKTETLLAYAKRCAKDVEDRPEFYFMRFENRVTKSEVAEAERHLTQLLGEVDNWWLGEVGHYRNVESCQQHWGTCAYLPICSRNDMTGFRVFEQQKRRSG